MTETNPDLAKIDSAFRRLEPRARRSELSPSDPEAPEPGWHPLSVTGFAELRLQQAFQQADRPVEHLVWMVAVGAGQLARFPRGLILQYAMETSALGESGSLYAKIRLRSFAEAHLKRDLFLAKRGDIPLAWERIVFLSDRGWLQRVVDV